VKLDDARGISYFHIDSIFAVAIENRVILMGPIIDIVDFIDTDITGELLQAYTGEMRNRPATSSRASILAARGEKKTEGECTFSGRL
jgi:hypothetical protein